jgi:hypothetical protein
MESLFQQPGESSRNWFVFVMVTDEDPGGQLDIIENRFVELFN